MTTRPNSKTIDLIAILALAVAAIVFFWQTELSLTSHRAGAPLDDAWIHFQFARNLSQGYGFSYNPGELTPGSTAPLWTLLLVPIGWFSLDFLTLALLLSATFFLLTVAFTYGLGFELTRSRLAAGLAAGGVILSGRLVWAGLAGMETTAFTCLSLAAVWVYTRRGLSPLSALLFGLASQLRPEGHFLFALALLDTGWQIAIEGKAEGSLQPVIKRNLMSVLSSLAIYGLIAAPYAIFSLAITGKPLPNTFYAKSGTEHFFSWQTLRETVVLHWYDNPVSMLLLPFGLMMISRRSRIVVGWLVGLPLLTAVVVDFVWHHGRYTMPLIPFQMIVAAAGGVWLLEAGKKRLIRKSAQGESEQQGAGKNLFRQQLAQVMLGVILAIGFFMGGWWQFGNWATMLGSNVNEILEVDVALGNWLAANTPADALLAVDDIGAITFLSQRRVVDLNGLVSPEMWPAIQQPWGLARNQAATRILSELGPDYMVAFPLWHWEIVTNPTVSVPIHQVRADSQTILPQQDVVVLDASWPYLAEAYPQEGLDAVLGKAVRLLGYDLQLANENDLLELTLYWQSLETLAPEYDVFVHVLDSDNQIVAQVDQQPLNGLAPTSLWQPGDIIRDPYTITLPPNLPAGVYHIQAGMYLRESGARLPATGEQSTGDTILVGQFGLPG